MINLINVHKYYPNGESKAHILKGVNLSINKGEFCIIYGPSGSGKTTLLNIMGTLENCDEGSVYYENNILSNISKKKMQKLREQYVGYIFQNYNLFQNLTSVENVMMGAYLADNLMAVDEILEKVGLTEHKNKYPFQLSGGQQQRVAIARALAKKPRILFCDEPTGALDSKMSIQILNILQKLQQNDNLTIVMVTHNPNIKEIATKVIYLFDGKITSIEENSKPKSIFDIGENTDENTI